MVELSHIRDARERIAPFIFHTPVIRMENLDGMLGCQVYIKPECLQRTNSFKVRGALNRMLKAGAEKLKDGVVAASSGNHGKGVAFTARLMGIKATIVVPEATPQVKVDGILKLGASVVKCKAAERHEVAGRLSEELGLTIIHPYDDYDIMAGQGTIGLEVMESIPGLSQIVVPVGGGGLIGGIATAVKSLDPAVMVIGAEPALMPRYTRSLSSGAPIQVDERPTIADALRTLKPGERNFPIVQKYVDEVIDVREDLFTAGMKALLLEGRLLVEPSSAAGIAAALQGDIKAGPSDKVCFVVSGGSVGLSQVRDILGQPPA
ncbi:MAG: threonine/serine dehydratase [Firmicutes bacterium]|nr:threonine/serine dehydratase [Bacillota bacterium]